MKYKIRSVKVLAPLAVLLLSACAEQPNIQNDPYVADGGDASINAGGINSAISMPDTRLPSLGNIRSLHRIAGVDDSPKKKAKLAQLRDDALAYGLQSGLYAGTREIDRRLNEHAAELSDIYNFNNFLIKDKSGQLLLPPVITEQDDLYQSDDGGKTISVADKMYTIEKNVTFAPTSPLWHTYLLQSFQKATPPENSKLPSNPEEQAVWARYVTEGYDRGLHQAVDIFKQDMRQLQHDFGGMVRYYALLENHQISAPYVAETNLGVTGDADKAVYNNRVLKLMDIPKLVVSNPEKIRSSVSVETPAQSIRNPYETFDDKGWKAKSAPSDSANTGDSE